MHKIFSRQFNSNQTHQGFTLVELVFYLAIAAIMILSISNLFGVISEMRLRNQVALTVEEEGRHALNYILQTVRNSSSVANPSPNNIGASLSLNIAGVANVFDLYTNRLRLTEGASQSIFLTSDKLIVSNLTFQNLANSSTKDNIRVQFELRYLNSASRSSYNYGKIFIGTAQRR
ncbi:MAG TPA: prepilin-type N-terminal cleavage/methylation domain-containing protein [bacterium]|nr:prepilin-type N-terminal cleavage/methylation domain-containing protein [bacterium]